MDVCQATFDSLIMEHGEDMSNAEWIAIMMQIIMILVTYQKVFDMTHNDLHTNNIMYNKTKQKNLYYKFNGTVYKVPTYGRIFKIIDFGRAIYQYGTNRFMSDSFSFRADAATQYNTEPYFNPNKKRIEPNRSFDLCRLACSLIDYVIDDLNETKRLETLPAYKRIIVEWCCDDNGLNMLYKSNGLERYPDFKLYKMITRCVHKHNPDVQLLRPEFMSFAIAVSTSPHSLIDIDVLEKQY